MKKKQILGLLAMAMALGLTLLGCSNPASNSTVDEPLVLKDTVDGKVVEITISRTDPSKAVIKPQKGDYFVIKLDGVVISKGTVTQVTSSGAMTFKPSADSPGPKTEFTGTLSSGGALSIPSIPYEGGTITGVNADSSGGSGGGAPTPAPPSGGGGGDNPPAANVFENTTWKTEDTVTNGGVTNTYVLTISFGTDIWTTVQVKNGEPIPGGQAGTYTASGNTATCTTVEGDTFPATISGNKLTIDVQGGMQFTKVTPATNVFVGTAWSFGYDFINGDGDNVNHEMTVSFGTATVTWNEIFTYIDDGRKIENTYSYPYTVSGKNANIDTGNGLSAATISGNTLVIIYDESLLFTKASSGASSAANSFAGTVWKFEDDKNAIHFEMTASFDGTTCSIEQTVNGIPRGDFSGTYTVSGNTATITFDFETYIATISGNTLTLRPFITFARVY